MDIRDQVQVTECFARADGFIHLAGVLGTQETIMNPAPAAHTNILGGLNILKLLTSTTLEVCILQLEITG